MTPNLPGRLRDQAQNVELEGWLNAARYMREAADELEARASPATQYTIKQLDDAIRAITGPGSVRPGDYGWHRVTAMSFAAAHAWTEQRPEDEHSRMLRTAMLDLKQDGFLHPVGGWGAE